MAVPDETYFGKNENGDGINYGDVRKETDPDKIIQLLNFRLNDILINQVNELHAEPDGQRKVYSPFPLVIMTCVAIETLGVIFYSNDGKQGGKNQNHCFVSFINHFDKKFSRPLSKSFKNSFKTRFLDDTKSKPNTYAELFYTYFRNTFIHGYRGMAVYIEESITKYEIRDGFMVINPNWFWSEFKVVYEDHFNQALNNNTSNNPLRISALAYMKSLLK